MGFNDFQRGDRDGYQGMPTRPASNAEEAMGRAAGQERRHQEFLQTQASAGEYQSIPPRFALYAIGLLGLFALAKWQFDADTAAIALLAGSVVALLLIRPMRRLLGRFALLYIGLASGTALGALSLVIRGTPLTAGNIAVHVILGGVLGIVLMFTARRRRT
jgi:hypothetical protein